VQVFESFRQCDIGLAEHLTASALVAQSCKRRIARVERNAELYRERALGGRRVEAGQMGVRRIADRLTDAREQPRPLENLPRERDR
jgi:hypothetical protein